MRNRTAPFARRATWDLPAVHWWNWLALVLMILFLATMAANLAFPRSAYARPDSPGTLASGTKLYVRLETGVSTKTSHLNQPARFRVVREVATEQGVLIPIGAEVNGIIAKLIPTSDPADRARLLVRFTQLAIPSHPLQDFVAHLTEVENARETVLLDGTIQGVLEKDAAVGRMDGLLDRLGSAGSEMEIISNKTFGKADQSIDLPAGTDMVLTLDQPLTLDFISPVDATPVSLAAMAAVQALLADAPSRAESRTKKLGDPLNLVVIGTDDQIVNAFQHAGWSAAKKLGTRSAVGTVRAMASDQGYGQAPVSQLFLFGHAEDFAFEKMLNTFLKRHHLRLWQTSVITPDGREIWLGACTHDIGLDIHLGVVSHAIDPDLDAERNKVGADLLAGGMAAAEKLVLPPNPLSEGRAATGGTWKTDGRLLVIELKTPGTL